MRRKISPLIAAALTGTLWLSATEAWSHPENVENRDRSGIPHASKNPEQPNMNMDDSWNRTGGIEMNSDKVKEVQQALQQKGHDPGEISGVVDVQTEAALRSFQQSAGLKPTGRLDHETMARLGITEHSSSQESSAG